MLTAKDRRVDSLGEELNILFESLLKKGLPLTAQMVIAHLRAHVGSPESCIVNVTTSAIIWKRPSTGDHEKCDFKALKQRIRRWRDKQGEEGLR